MISCVSYSKQDEAKPAAGKIKTVYLVGNERRGTIKNQKASQNP